MLYAFGIAALFAFVGLLGAGAFNPDSGFLLQSEPLWRVFGIAAYLGWLAIPLLALVAFGRLAVALARRASERCRQA